MKRVLHVLRVCHRLQKPHLMLVPHFSQMWVFLTPATDELTLGLLGERFPGKRRAASGVRKQPLD